MALALIVALYIAVYIWGCKKIKGRKKIQHRLLYGIVLGYGAYIHISGYLGVKYFSMSTIYTKYFQPVGQAIIHGLGG